MKLIIKILISPLIIIILFLCLFIGKGSSSSSHKIVLANGTVSNQGLSELVLKHQPMLEKYASEHGISEYVPYLLAIMQVESGGNLKDVMQSSESKGLPVNTLDTEESIEQGVKHFKNVLDLGKEANLDIFSSIQAYNFGTNFIRWSKTNNLTWSIDVAERYSREIVAPALGNHSAQTYNYVNEVSKKHGKTYLYSNGGNFYYVELVKQYLVFDEQGSLAQSNYSNIDTGLPLADWNKVLVTSNYGWRDIGVGDEFHTGTDFVYNDGRVNPTVHSVADGVVIFSGFESGGGNSVIVKHAEDYYTYYLHLRDFAVGKGDRVTKGQVVGIMGTTGRSTGVHLHFSISRKYWGEYIDPMTVLPKP